LTLPVSARKKSQFPEQTLNSSKLVAQKYLKKRNNTLTFENYLFQIL